MCDRLLQQTIDRAKYVHSLQENAYDIFLDQIAEQISFLSSIGITSIKILIPQFVNRIPIDRKKCYKKIKKKLKKYGYKLKKTDVKYEIIVSWYFV